MVTRIEEVPHVPVAADRTMVQQGVAVIDAVTKMILDYDAIQVTAPMIAAGQAKAAQGGTVLDIFFAMRDARGENLPRFLEISGDMIEAGTSAMQRGETVDVVYKCMAFLIQESPE